MTIEAHALDQAQEHAHKHVKTPRTDTRARILAVAAHLFATQGFAGTSIKDIANELRVTKAALYYHFGSKELLLQAIVSQPILAMGEVMSVERDLTRPVERKRFVVDVITAMAGCDADAVAVFKDPSLAQLVDHTVLSSGITHQLSMRLAMGLSGTADPEGVQPAHLMRSIAAVAAGYETINNWHVVYPECALFSPDDIEVIAGFVSDVLEAGRA